MYNFVVLFIMVFYHKKFKTNFESFLKRLKSHSTQTDMHDGRLLVFSEKLVFQFISIDDGRWASPT